MKKVFIFHMFLVLSISSYSQDTTIYLKYDFLKDNKKDFVGKNRINYRGNIIFSISDLNLFLYDINIKSEEKNYFNDQSSIINSIENVVNSLNILEIPKIYFGVIDYDRSNEGDYERIRITKDYLNAQINNTSDVIKNLNKAINEYNGKKMSLEVKKINNKSQIEFIGMIAHDIKNSDTLKLISNFNLENNIIDQEIRILDSQYKRDSIELIIQLKDMDQINFKIDSVLGIESKWKDNIKQNQKISNFEQLIRSYQNSIIKLQDCYKFYHQLLALLNTDGKSFVNINTNKNSLASKFFGDTLKENILGRCYDRLEKVDSDYNELQYSYNLIDESIRTKYKLSSLFQQVSTSYEKLQNNKYELLFIQIAKLYDAFNINNFSVIHRLHNVKADEIIYNVRIKPKQNLIYSMPNRNEDFGISIKTHGGVKIDFSTGLFLNFGDKNYSFKNQYDNSGNLTDTFFIQKNSFLRGAVPSIGVLMHIYSNIGLNFNWGGCFGICTSDADNIRYYFGTSFLFGEKQRFILNAGLGYGKYLRLKDDFEENKKYSISLKPDNIPIQKVNNFGFFLGVSYNLTGDKENLFIGK